MSNGDLNICIFTKDNESVLSCLLGDLRRVCDAIAADAAVTIIDDSVQASSRDQVSRLAEAYPELRVDIVRVDEQRSIKGTGEGSVWLRRPLGTAGYDVGTCRNVAFAHVLSSATRVGRPTLFLDADIRLVLAEIDGTAFHVDGAKVVTEMLRSVATDPRLIVGAPLIGRADISLLEHLECGLHEPSDVQRARSSAGCHLIRAILVGRNVPGFGQPLGMSGGALCVGAEALREAPMMSIYNEDILWLTYLRGRGFRLVPTAEPLIHADAKPLRIESSVVRQHAFGEAMWLTVATCGWAPTSQQQLREAWSAAVILLSEELRGVARRVGEGRDPSGGSLPGELMDLGALLQYEAQWIAAIPVARCIEVLELFRMDVTNWQALWTPC